MGNGNAYAGHPWPLASPCWVIPAYVLKFYHCFLRAVGLDLIDMGLPALLIADMILHSLTLPEPF